MFLNFQRFFSLPAPGERGSHEVKTRRTNCDPGCKKYYRRENICSETNIQNVQNGNIYRCVTFIYIYILVRQVRNCIVNSGGVIILICLP